MRILRLVLASLAGCIQPPVVMEADDPAWTLEASHYPPGTQLVEIPSGGEVLRGILVPGDPGGPLVVHFAAAGESVTHGSLRDQYLPLGRLGFASLVVDYRGVGRSGGSRDAAHLAEDARAIHGYALELAGGDERRLVLRGVSLGTLAIGVVLEDGARPAGVVLYAPVLGDSVATHFGRARVSPWLTWLAGPFLRPVTDVDLVEVLADVEGTEVLMVGAADDELLSRPEWEALSDAVRRAGGQVVENPAAPEDVNLGEGVPRHMIHAARARAVGEEEQRCLAALFPAAPAKSWRLQRVLEEAPHSLTDRLDTDSRGRLGELAAHYRYAPRAALVAAAVVSPDEATAATLLDLEDHGSPTPARRLEDLDAACLLAHFELRDACGPLDAEVVAAARSFFLATLPDATAEPWDAWSLDDLMELTHQLTAPYTAGLVPWSGARARQGQTVETPGGRGDALRDVVIDGGLTVVKVLPRVSHPASGSEHTELGFPPLGTWVGQSLVLTPEDRARRILRVMLKGAGHPERVVPLADGGWGLEVYRFTAEPPGWYPLPLPPSGLDGERFTQGG